MPSDRENWDRVKASADRRQLEEFRRQFPNSPFAADALKRVEQLDARDRATLQEQELLARTAEGRRLVAEAMERYVAAYRQRDLTKLRDIWPGMGRERSNALQEFFRANKSLDFEASPAGEPQLEGDSALLRCAQSIKIPAGKPIRTSVDIRFRRSGPVMIIDSITVVK